MHKRLFVLLLVCVFVGVLSMSQAANIYMDEDFEGSVAFQDQNWPVQDETVTAWSVTPKGVNIRSYDNDPTRISPKPVFSNTGSVVSTRKFLGTKSLQLTSGQLAKGAPADPATGIADNNIGETHVIQFAVSTADSVAALPANTQVGHFKWDWSVNTTTQIEASLVLNLVTNAQGKVDLKCQNNGATVATLTPGAGNWALVSLIGVMRVTSPEFGGQEWRTYDPATSTFKGPQPDNPVIPPTQASNDNLANWKNLGSGIQIFVNDNSSTITKVLPDQVGAGWGNDNDANIAGHASVDMGWEIAAENNGTIYVDNLYWDAAGHNSVMNQMELEMAARMQAFGKATIEQAGPPVAAAKTWDLY